MSEFWLIVTLCALPTIHWHALRSEPADPELRLLRLSYRALIPFHRGCRLHQIYLNRVPLERHKITASLCTARLDRARLGELPLQSIALGDHA